MRIDYQAIIRDWQEAPVSLGTWAGFNRTFAAAAGIMSFHLDNTEAAIPDDLTDDLEGLPEEMPTYFLHMAIVHAGTLRAKLSGEVMRPQMLAALGLSQMIASKDAPFVDNVWGALALHDLLTIGAYSFDTVTENERDILQTVAEVLAGAPVVETSGWTAQEAVAAILGEAVQPAWLGEILETKAA